VDINGNESKEKIYFVIETKGTMIESGRRGFENQKIKCAKRHFEVIDVRYKDVASYGDFERELVKE
jgi:type III restriction enzyme